MGETEAIVGLRGLLVPHVFVVIRDLNHKALVGMGFLQQTRCKLDMKANLASFFDDLVILPLFGKPTDQASNRYILVHAQFFCKVRFRKRKQCLILIHMETAYTANLNTYINSCLTYLFARESIYYGGTEDIEELRRNQHPMIPENTHVAVHFVHMENWECYDMYQHFSITSSFLLTYKWHLNNLLFDLISLSILVM